jgi:hypothetical protein
VLILAARWFSMTLGFEEGFERPEIRALQARFVTGEGWLCRRCGEIAIGEGERGDWRVAFAVGVHFFLLDYYFIIQEVSFDGPQPALAPFCGDHFFDQLKLGWTSVRLIVGSSCCWRSRERKSAGLPIVGSLLGARW